MPPSNMVSEEVAARIKAIDRRVRRLETLEAAAGCLNLIEEIVLTSAAASITFSDITDAYKHLWLWTDFVGPYAIGAESVALRFNGDSAENYSWGYFIAASGFDDMTGVIDESDIHIEIPANSGGQHEINILNYAVTGKDRYILWKGNFGRSFWFGDPGASWLDTVQIGRGRWKNTVDAINQITINNNAGGSYQAGTRLTLYGLC